jgi:hypothetical protein
MNRSLRRYVTVITSAVCAVSFGAFLWLFFSYFATHPTLPRPDLGLVYALNNHGSRVYVSAPEATGLALLLITFLAGMALSIAVIPKVFTPRTPTTPRWLRYASISVKTDMGDSLSPRLWFIFLGSIGLSAAIIVLAGKWLAQLLVARGIVLHI